MGTEIPNIKPELRSMAASAARQAQERRCQPSQEDRVDNPAALTSPLIHQVIAPTTNSRRRDSRTSSEGTVQSAAMITDGSRPGGYILTATPYARSA